MAKRGCYYCKNEHKLECTKRQIPKGKNLRLFNGLLTKENFESMKDVLGVECVLFEPKKQSIIFS